MTVLDSGDITIKAEIGKGGFGTVFIAKNGKTDVVLKTLLRTPSLRYEETARREYDIGMKLNHPNIVKMRGSYETPENHCLVMDVVEGQDLFKVMEQNKFSAMPEADVRKMFKGLCKGLEYSHARGVAHLDIKPENIMVGKGGHTTLIDFGLASDSKVCTSYRGSPEYAAPEIWRRMPYNPASADVWSLGVVLFIALCGYSPFDTASAAATMVLSPILDWPRHIEISHQAKALVESMLQVNPADRPTMKEILQHRWITKGSIFQRLSPLPPRKARA